jgi:tripartite-type tricarboxylate transporter receptor subunit TctC
LVAVGIIDDPRHLNINNTTRHWDFPDIPTLTELGHPDSDVPIWYSVQGPPGLPQEIAEKLNAKMLELSKTASIQKSLRAVSAALQPMSTKEMAAFFAADSQNNAAVIKAANIKLE